MSNFQSGGHFPWKKGGNGTWNKKGKLRNFTHVPLSPPHLPHFPHSFFSLLTILIFPVYTNFTFFFTPFHFCPLFQQNEHQKFKGLLLIASFHCVSLLAATILVILRPLRFCGNVEYQGFTGHRNAVAL